MQVSKIIVDLVERVNSNKNQEIIVLVVLVEIKKIKNFIPHQENEDRCKESNNCND